MSFLGDMAFFRGIVFWILRYTSRASSNLAEFSYTIIDSQIHFV